MVRTKKNLEKMCCTNDTVVRTFFIFLLIANVFCAENVEQSSYSKVVKSSTINNNNGKSDGPQVHRALSTDLWFPAM